jgi:hypothetical protein
MLSAWSFFKIKSARSADREQEKSSSVPLLWGIPAGTCLQRANDDKRLSQEQKRARKKEWAGNGVEMN